MDTSLNCIYHLCGSCWYLWPGIVKKRPRRPQREEMEFGVIPQDRSNEVADLLINSFFRDEPLGLALGLSTDQAKRWLPDYISNAIADSASIMALDPETNKIIGASVNILKLPGKEIKPMMSYLCDSEYIMKRVARFLDHLNEGIDLEDKFGVKKVLITLFLNVEQHYCGRGIAMELAKRTEDLAKQIDCELMQVDTTSEYSYKAYKKMNYDVMKEVEISEFSNFGDGVRLSPEQLGIHNKARVLCKRIS